jgi:DNA-binding response OmpR family regulator
METVLTRMLQPRIEALKVLIVDDDQYMRKVVRAMLMAIGVKTVFDASDGVAGLEAVRQHNPDLVIVDWEMPMIDGAQFVRMVRSPGEFRAHDVPIIMLSGHGDRWRVVEAARIGAHEYLLKPVSTKALLDRIVAILGKPRPFVQMNGYYGPAPRRPAMIADRKMDDGVPGPLPVGHQPAAPQASGQPVSTQQPATLQPSSPMPMAGASAAPGRTAAPPSFRGPATPPRPAAPAAATEKSGSSRVKPFGRRHSDLYVN